MLTGGLTAARTHFCGGLLTPYVVFQGTGGEGKTSLAAELARWLVETQRFDRAAFVCLERRPDPRNVLHALGEQLVSGFSSPKPRRTRSRPVRTSSVLCGISRP